MIRRSFVLSAAAISLTLAGCGGGGNSPTPTPSPTPSPTPTASPTPVSYLSFPLTAATEFGTINSFLAYSGDPAAGPVVLGVAGTESGSTRFRLAAVPDPTAISAAAPAVVRENLEEGRYIAPAELIVAPATTVPEFVFNNTLITKNSTATTVLASRAEFLNNTVTGKVTADTALALTSVSYAGWIRDESAAGAHRVTYGVWGYPTVASDLPTTTVTYTARIAGRTVGVIAAGTGTVQKLGGTVTVTINFATGSATVTANVTTVGAGGVETPYGTYSGTGAIASGATQFTGSFGPTSPIPGTFTGTVFGAVGKEIGISFAASGTVGAADTRLVGVMVGKKN